MDWPCIPVAAEKQPSSAAVLRLATKKPDWLPNPALAFRDSTYNAMWETGSLQSL